MTDRQEYAVRMDAGGCNCCQSVLMAFADETDLTEEQLRKLGAAFGVGMGCRDATCGALVGAGMALGLLKYRGKPVARDAAQLLGRFRELSGATLCHELKGRETGVVLCACSDCIRNAVTALEEQLG